MSTSIVDSRYAAVRREHTLAAPYERFTRAFESLLGVMQVDALRNIAELSPEAARTKLASFVGPLDFSLFQKLDHGTLISKLAGRSVQATTYVFGNALIAVEMTKRSPTIGLYVPLRLHVRETGPGETKASYDLPSATVAQFDSPEANEVARALDTKVERIIAEAQAQCAST